jgi:hypothetical protein
MFESLFSFVIPFVKEVLMTAAAALLAYALNKVQSHFQSI